MQSRLSDSSGLGYSASESEFDELGFCEQVPWLESVGSSPISTHCTTSSTTNLSNSLIVDVFDLLEEKKIIKELVEENHKLKQGLEEYKRAVTSPYHLLLFCTLCICDSLVSLLEGIASALH
jgi:hypothetical protein